MTKKEKLVRVRKLVEPIYRKLKIWPHGWSHVKNVAKFTKLIAEREGENTYLCQLAAYLHDLGRLQEEARGPVDRTPGVQGHAELSTEPAKEILDKVKGLQEKDKKAIIEAIHYHSLKEFPTRNPIGLILQDADKWDGIGRFGAARLAAFNAEMPITGSEARSDPDKVLEKILKFASNNKNQRDKLITAMRFVVEWYDLLNTKSAKELLKKDWEFSKKYLQKLEELNR
ncbi:MAG: HD domain-containing protein [Candidatus Berkelbacteria bacterium]|nr:HD domain-containing protein [Candidatus Berkelbacteria bacterium]